MFAYAETNVNLMYCYEGWVNCWEDYQSYVGLDLYQDGQRRGGGESVNHNWPASTWFSDSAAAGFWQLWTEHELNAFWYLDEYGWEWFEPQVPGPWDYRELSVTCAVPVSFAISEGPSCGIGNGLLGTRYVWGSSTGNLQDLQNCRVREQLSYENGGALPSPPFPPYTYTFDNDRLGGVATTGETTDLNRPPEGQFVMPYSEARFSASQRFEYNCTCQYTSSYTPFPGFTDMEILRRVTQDGGTTWKYGVTKHGTPCTWDLPQ